MRNNAYPTCKETYATLRIYPIDGSTDDVTKALRINPTNTQQGIPAREEAGTRYAAKPQGWFLSTKAVTDSNDIGVHLDWLFERLIPVRAELKKIQDSGAHTDIFCYWVSAYGNGGPTISPAQAEKLAFLKLECGFDIYFDEAKDG